MALPELRLDKTAFSVGTLEDQGDDRAYWLSKSPLERLEALEYMRQVAYGVEASTERLQRVFEVAELARR